MNWDAEIWAPCRLGEAFTLREFRSEHTEYLYAIKADWMNQHGDAMCVRFPEDLTKSHPYGVRLGAGPRPWGSCWTYEAAIKITPPVWCWDMQDDTMFGLDLKLKRNGNRRKAKLDCVMIHEGRPVYRMVIETSDGPSHRYYDSIPVLDPYFAPIWPTTAEETPEVAAPVVEQTTDSVKSTDVAILPSLANCPEQDTTAAFAVGGITPGPALELEADPGELIVPVDQLRRVLTTSNADDLAACCMAQADEDTPATWTGTENRPPGVCIGGQTPINRNYYYYVWFEEPPTEGETHEQKAGP